MGRAAGDGDLFAERDHDVDPAVGAIRPVGIGRRDRVDGGAHAVDDDAAGAGQRLRRPCIGQHQAGGDAGAGAGRRDGPVVEMQRRGVGIVQAVRLVALPHRVREHELVRAAARLVGGGAGGALVAAAAAAADAQRQRRRPRDGHVGAKGHSNAHRGADPVRRISARRKNRRDPRRNRPAECRRLNDYAGRVPQRPAEPRIRQRRIGVVAGLVPNGGGSAEDQGAGAAVL